MNLIFKEYDVRGIYPSEINEEVAYKIGRAFVRLTKEKNIVVGRDIRASSEPLALSFIRGVLDEGANVTNIGKCTTSFFYFALWFYKYKAGAIVTASHNPKEYNGFKLCGKEAEVYGYENGLKKVEEIVNKESFSESKNKGKAKGKNFFNEYKKFILKFAKGLGNYKIVLDYGNGTEALFAPKILSSTSLRTISINEKIDGNFPAHGPDPLRKGALKQLGKKVKKEKADLGIAFDADSDRVIFVDEKGKEIRPDHILAFFVEEMLRYREGKIFVYDASCTKMINEIAKENGGKAIRSKIGRTNVRKKCAEHNADFGGELSGHYFLKEYFNSENGLLTLFKLVRYMKKENKKLSELLKRYKKYYQIGPINLKVKNRDEILKKIEKRFKDASIENLDGLIVNYDNLWFIVRPSNTEPLIRIVIEGKNKKEVEQQKKELLKLVKND